MRYINRIGPISTGVEFPLASIDGKMNKKWQNENDKIKKNKKIKKIKKNK